MIMKKLFGLTLAVALSFFMCLNCADNAEEPPEEPGGTPPPTTISESTVRKYELIPNFNNDACFDTKNYNAITNIACSLVSIPTIEFNEKFYSGREVLYSIVKEKLEVESAVKHSDKSLYDAANSKYSNTNDILDDSIILGDESSESAFLAYVIDFDGQTWKLDEFLYDQSLEFDNFVNAAEMPITNSTISGREHDLFPNYLNDNCFSTQNTLLVFSTCSLIAVNTIKTSQFSTDESTEYYSGREYVGMLVGIAATGDAGSSGYSDVGLYDAVEQSYKEDINSFVTALAGAKIPATDGEIYDLKTFITYQIKDFDAFKSSSN